MKSFYAWFIDRPLIVNLVMIMGILLGFYSLQTGAIKSAPDLSNGRFSITTLRPGASAEKMELSVTVPLEEELESVDGIRELRSNSAEGMSLIQVNADPEADKAQLAEMARDLQRAIDRAQSRLPTDLLEKPLLVEAKSADFPVAIVMLYGQAPEATLRKLARSLQDQLRSLRGVRGVDRLGYRDREIHIQLDPLKLDRLGVSYAEIERAIKSRNVTETGGSLASFVGEQDIVAVGEFSEPKEVASVIVRSDGYGNHLRIKDLAKVTEGFSEATVSYYKGGLQGIVLTVRAQADSNELTLSEDIKSLLNTFRKNLPSTVQLSVVDDGADITKVVISTLLDNAMLGAILITLVLLFFFPWRSTFWVVVGIPVAVLLGIALMPIFGVTYNTVAFVAIILMLGLLVDDAIVTSESIYSHFESGMSIRDAAVNGVNSVSSPVITGALTTVFAMMPLLLIGGEDAKFMWVIPATVVLIILASLFECLILLPSHIAGSLKRAEAGRDKASWFRHVQHFYAATLTPMLRRPMIAMSGGLALFFLSIVMLSHYLQFESYPDTDATDITIGIEMPAGTTIDTTAAVINRIEQRALETIPDGIITGHFSVVGEWSDPNSDDMIQVKSPSLGKVQLTLVSGRHRELSAAEIRDRLKQLRPEFTQAIRFVVDIENEQPPVGTPVEARVIAHSDEVRGEIADALMAWLSKQRGVTEVWTSYTPGKNLIELKLDYAATANAGIAVADVTRALRIAYDGLLVEELQTVEERIRYRLELQDKYRNDINALRSLTVLNPSGEQVPLRNIAQFQVRQGQAVIAHYGGRRAETIRAEVNRDQLSVVDINHRLQAWLDEKQFAAKYPGVRVELGGELVAQAETAESMGTGLMIVLVSIFFLMVLLFNSLSQPLIIMAVIPLAFVAVLIVLTLHGFVLGVSAIVGFLGLAGVLVNSSLVLVDKVNKLHHQSGQPGAIVERSAIAEAAAVRLRPILITALTTSAGLGPAAYGIAGAHPTQTPMIMVMFWGGIVGAITTLYTVPLMLAIDSDIRLWWQSQRQRRSSAVQ
ncbi:efflux RND transporter permease subunit [Spongiibacter sp. UBA1325]|uniref:efflux RND transporter permease subunit n=1 Tax=Spongiibacter sp. UBA1325 TaxID=1947543 RepID=UPI0025810766|nr:efflux RND transporter permease subunit [Spongiibacter sp. UBA1325]|tara:strand:- start:23572 stop:26709 length:3138 start_codon:yes stop_codon:yes gene_type:complete